MKQRKVWIVLGNPATIGVLLLASGVPGWAQTSNPGTSSPPSDSLTTAVVELQQQVSELRAAVAEVRAEAAQYRAETAELRRELETFRGKPEVAAEPNSHPAAAQEANAQAAPEAGQPASLEQRVTTLEESSQLLNSKLGDQYQVKVESASK